MHDDRPGASVRWRKSSFSGGNSGPCVEVAFSGDTVLVRDSKQCGAGPVLTLSRPAWDAFLSGVGAGEFERP